MFGHLAQPYLFLLWGCLWYHRQVPVAVGDVNILSCA